MNSIDEDISPIIIESYLDFGSIFEVVINAATFRIVLELLVPSSENTFVYNENVAPTFTSEINMEWMLTTLVWTQQIDCKAPF